MSGKPPLSDTSALLERIQHLEEENARLKLQLEKEEPKLRATKAIIQSVRRMQDSK